MKKSLAKGLKEKRQSKTPELKSDSYKQANLQKIPDSLTKDLKNLMILDISHNFLENFHADIIFKTAIKLKSVYINDNHINILPASLTGLKELTDFRHDWNILIRKTKEEKLKQIQGLCRKPDKLVKVSSVLGINFISYCEEVINIKIGIKKKQILQMVRASQCSVFAKEEISKLIQVEENPQENIKISSAKPKKLFDCNYNCFNNMFSNKQKPEEAVKPEPTLQKPVPSKIKIQQIKTIQNNKLNETQINTTQDSFMTSSDPGKSLFKVFTKFDSNPQKSISEADYAFRSGFNPNSYDKNGLTIFHICVINNQRQGLKYLFKVNNNNPGFLDLQTRTMHEGRNLFHLSVFLKKIQIALVIVESGFPLNKRDNFGNRGINLVDQNFQFLYTLKKRMKTTKERGKKFIRHPNRYHQESQFSVTQNYNTKLLTMYDAATLPQTATKHKLKI